ncbi:MAG: type II toxin-antitoxin system HicB family antitoxin [Candidatus Aenigmarchaeota archaeon]|nr:type II toxin-antitoxin system HicB family antitoxin [Candidatus Aenigmarchaeota archaeon]
MVKINDIEYPIVFIKSEDAVTARCLTLPVVTQGETREDAEQMIAEAIQLHLECMEEIEQPDVANFSFGFVDVPVKLKNNQKLVPS